MTKKNFTLLSDRCIYFQILFFFIAPVISFAQSQMTFDNPFGIAVRPDSSFYVAEIKGKCIKKFDSEGNYIGQIKNIGQYGFLKGLLMLMLILPRIFISLIL